MYVNTQYKILYCHPCKTGGSSIVAALNSISPDDVNLDKGKAWCLKYTYHIPLDYIELRLRKEAGVDSSDFTKVISVRNTYGRIFSHWKDYVVDGIKAKGQSLKQILSFTNYIYSRFIDGNDPSSMERRSLLYYFPENESNLEIIHYQNINEETTQLIKKIFGKTLKKIPHKNNKKELFGQKAMKRFLQREKNYHILYGKKFIEYQDIYTDETREIVADFFKEEIKYFNYEF